MYPKRLILEDARHCGIEVLGLDVGASGKEYSVEVVDEGGGPGPARPWWLEPEPGGERPHRRWGIRLALSEVKGISEAEVDRIVAARPYHSLSDFWHRARVSRPVVERLVLAGGFDATYGLGTDAGGSEVRRRGTVTRRDLLLQVAELDRHGRAVERAAARGRGRSRAGGGRTRAQQVAEAAAARNSSEVDVRERQRERESVTDRDLRGDRRPHDLASDLTGRSTAPSDGIWGRSLAQARTAPTPPPVESVQLALDLGDAPGEGEVSGLPEMTAEERMRAELEILGLDASRHVVDTYGPFLDALGVTRSRDLLGPRSGAELLVAGVKVATQTPPIRSGRRVIFLTLDDGTGPVDATFFEDAQGPYAATVFHSWLLVVRGVLRRTGYRGVSLRATGCWELPVLHQTWREAGVEAVREAMAVVPEGFGGVGVELAGPGAAESRASRPVMARPPTFGDTEQPTAGGMGQRRVLVHSSGFKLSPYADIKPAGDDTKDVARKLWHRSPGSPG
jgi:error-prone DNA polymerase